MPGSFHRSSTPNLPNHFMHPRRRVGCRMEPMNIQELETEALKLDPKSRARLAGKLLNSLEELSEDEVTQLWSEEAQRRDAQMDSDPGSELPAEDVLREAWSSFKRVEESVSTDWPGRN